MDPEELPGNQTYNPWRLEQFGSLLSPEGDPYEDPDADGPNNRFIRNPSDDRRFFRFEI